MMGWLVRQVVVAVLLSALAVNLIGAIHKIGGAVRASLFVGVCTLFTTTSGMRLFKSVAGNLRQKLRGHE